MATDITTARVNTARSALSVACRQALWLLGLLPAVALSADSEFAPQLRLSSYGYQLKQEPANDWDKGAAATVSPILRWTLNGNNLKSSLFWQTESIWYDDAQRDHKNYNEYRFNNVLSGFDQRVQWGVNAASSYQVRNSQLNVFADKITGAEFLSRNSSYGSFLNFQTFPTAKVNTALNLNYRRNKSEAPDVQDGFSTFDNDQYSAALQLASRDRSADFFWVASGSYGRTTREVADDFISETASFLIGVPLYHRVSVIGRASYESNNSSSSFNNDFRSYGAGLELKLGRVSRVNVSVNRSTTTNPLQEEDETYVAGDFYLAPSRRTSLSGYWDRRYFGRTAVISGQYNLRHLTMRLSVNDTVRSMSALDYELEDLNFICPDGSTNIGDCFLRPPNYQPGAGEYEWSLPIVRQDIREDIVLRRAGTLNIGYNKNRLQLGLGVSISEDEYVELNRVNRSNNYHLNASWKLSEHMKLVSSVRFYQLKYVTEQRNDDNLSASVGLEKKLSAHSVMSVNVRRTSRESNIADRDISENRVWVSYQYNF